MKVRLFRFMDTLLNQSAMIFLGLYFSCDQISVLFPGIDRGKIFYIILAPLLVYIADRFRKKNSIEYGFIMGGLYIIGFIITLYILIFTFKGLHTSIQNVMYAHGGILFISLILLFGSFFDSKNPKISRA